MKKQINLPYLFILLFIIIFTGCQSKPDVTKNVLVNKDETNIPKETKYDDPRFEILRQKILQNPKDANTYAQMGYLYGLKGDVIQELYYYTKALDVRPNFKEVHYNMACIYALRGEKEKSLMSLEKAIIHGFNSQKTIEADKDLEQIRKEKGYQDIIQKYFSK